MNLLGKKVKHNLFGIGEITIVEEKYVTATFPARPVKFAYPLAFETFVRAIDEDVQEYISVEIRKLKEAEAEKKRLEDETRRIEEERRAQEKKVREENDKKNRLARRNMYLSIDEMFGEDYHVKYLTRQPILTYSEVETQFGIKISGFGRGINITDDSVVLISSIDKANGNFVYHDHWTEEGDYIYSGEGKNGDQILSRGNSAILNAEYWGKTLYLFVKFSPREYYFQGKFVLVDYKYEDDRDASGNMRKEYKFRLRKVIED